MLEWVCREMNPFARPWFVAGGWALDLFGGEESRPHADVDIAIFREDQGALRAALTNWFLEKVVNGERTPWLSSELLHSPVHEVHASNGNQRLEFLLNERTDDTWVFRRDPAVTLPIRLMGGVSADAVPYLAPEVVLLYKAKAPRSADEADFRCTLPKLSEAARAWLISALARCHPGHPWRSMLAHTDVA